MGNTGCYGCGGIPVPTPYPVASGVTTNIAPPLVVPPFATNTRFVPPYAGGIDLDPITPGIQARPGVVTPVGPPRVVGGGPGFRGPGVGRPFGASIARPY